MNRLFFCVLLLLNSILANAQHLEGRITCGNDPVPFANIIIEGSGLGVASDQDGYYLIKRVPLGDCSIVVSAIGMEERVHAVVVAEGVNVFDFVLLPSVYDLDQIVVTGTKTFKRVTDSPVIVGVIDSKKFESIQACNLADGLIFQSGLRVETDCQTCNYTQLRMNGLSGGYSQVLINGRAIFSPLASLYGMEQMPVNMIDRVEVIRGGGSALYGSSAVGGGVNVITKNPSVNDYSVGFGYNNINSSSDDIILYGNMSIVDSSKRSGSTFFFNSRDRMWYDHNGDNYSELPLLESKSFGTSLFFTPAKGHELDVSMGIFHEYRYGGEMVYGAPHLAMQAEERVHDLFLGNIDYQRNFEDGKSSFVTYLAFQSTDRSHYTGIRPDIGFDDQHILNPPYGISLGITKQLGAQFNYRLDSMLGSNFLTVGAEYLSDNIFDEISAYNYVIDQEVITVGMFLQSDWSLGRRMNLLSGIRLDRHSFLDDVVLSPRFSFLYNFYRNTQFRISYSTGFRAPQAFDADLHMAFAGGGVSRIELDGNLKEERSKSFSSSFNYDKAALQYIYGFTLEGFYTLLEGAFVQESSGEDEFGEIFVKRNGSGAVVSGFSMDFRFNYKKKFLLESGLTIQKSLYNDAVIYLDNLDARRSFLKSPNNYGYIMLDFEIADNFRASANLLYTGRMDLIHMAGSTGVLNNEYFTSEPFNALGVKATYVSYFPKIGLVLDCSMGVKNLTNSYQENFDVGKNRDSNFIYGPSSPRIFYFGLVIKSL